MDLHALFKVPCEGYCLFGSYLLFCSDVLCSPQVLLPLNGPGFEEQRAHMLIGVIVRAKSKRVFDHTTGNWKVVSGGQSGPAIKTNGKYGSGEKHVIQGCSFLARSPAGGLSPTKRIHFLFRNGWKDTFLCKQWDL